MLRKCCEILGLNMSATESDIRFAFDRLRESVRAPGSANAGAPDTGDQWEKLKEIAWARDTLLNYLKTQGEASGEPQGKAAEVQPQAPAKTDPRSTETEPAKSRMPWWLSSAGVIACAVAACILFYMYGPSPKKVRKNVVAPAGTMMPAEQPGEPAPAAPEKETGGFLQDVKKAVATVRFGQGQGSAFLISDDGYLVTNFHVINGPKGAAQLANGETVDVTVVKIAPESDFALLKTTSSGRYPFLRLGDSNSCREGDPVFAVGSPQGLESTFTKGIISARGRKLIPNSPVTFIQTDAAINHGNSGGPLINANGQVIGINTATVEKFVAEGLNFAIAINDVKRLIDEGRSKSPDEQVREASTIDARMKQEAQRRESLEQQRREQAANAVREQDKRYGEKVEAMKEQLEKMKKRQALESCLVEVDRQAEQRWNDNCARFSRSPRCTLPRDVYVAFNDSLIKAREECVTYYGQ
jgi:S1-C subfamily serine protease